MTYSRPEPWSAPFRLSELAGGPAARRLDADEETRARIAQDLDLVAVDRFSGEVRILPWNDGAELRGRFSAKVVYRCGVSLEPFDDSLTGEFTVRVVPPGSPFAAEPPESGGEVELDLEGEDPPDVLEGETVDLGAYLVEHLGLELDPFPRKPGAVFEPPPQAGPESPFAVLRQLKKE
jgi:hypothetical protein